MNRTQMPGSTSLVAIAATLMLSVGAILLSMRVEHATLFSGRPLILPGIGLPLPAWAYQGAIPLLILLGHRLAVRGAAPAPALRGLLTLTAAVAVGFVWLRDLALHDRWLSLFHCVLLLLVLLPQAGYSLRRFRLSAVVAAGCILAMVSYGAIWGEKDCDARSPVRCLEDTGLRVWVPAIMDEIGVPAFADLRRADLSHVSLRGRDLRYADLTGSELRGADLAGANLRRAKLDHIRAASSSWRSAYLDGATMASADLRQADLRDANGYRLNLRDSDLTGADLCSTSLSHAGLAGTKFDDTRLEGAYLRYSEGLAAGQLSRACGDRRTRLPPGISISICTSP